MSRHTSHIRSWFAVALAPFAVAACGADSPGSDVALSADGVRGQQIARTSGCAGCHGTNGQGQVGPPFVGLYGSTVTFDDGTTAEADEAYLRESIVDPAARQVEGFRLSMPENNLDDDDVDALIAYIRDLADAAEPDDSATGAVDPVSRP